MQKVFNKSIQALFLSCLIISSGQVFANKDRCAKIPGNWGGTSKVKSFLSTCEYTVAANYKTGNPAAATMTFSKTFGDASCPDNMSEENALITCDPKGRVNIDSSNIMLKGVATGDGLGMVLSGVFRVHLRSFMLDMDLHKE